MKQKLIAQGAEAKIFLVSDTTSQLNNSSLRAGGRGRTEDSEVDKNKIIIKNRISKSYRIKVLDDKIRKRRTKSEAKLLEKASKIINVPSPIRDSEEEAGTNNSSKILMPYIEGKKLSQHLDEFPLEKQKQILKQIGIDIAKLHNTDIIHGDLTTSNMILKDNKIYFIDFGLGFHSRKLEDKAVDIHVLKEALESKHFKNWEKLFDAFVKGYKNPNVLEQLKKVESRGRYKERY